MIDVSEAFLEFLETIQLKRKTTGSRDANGNWVDGTTTTINISAVVQSLTANERLALPEAVRTKETIKIHTQTELLTADEAAQIDADVVVYQGKSYLLTQVFNRNTIGNYFKAVGVRI